MTRRAGTFRGIAVDAVIDVRSHVEYWLGHLPGALCIPVTRLPEAMDKVEGLVPTSRILVYCASGARSASAAALLRSAGYRNVIDAGGMGDASQHFVAGQ